MRRARAGERKDGQELALARRHLRTDPVLAGLIAKYSDFNPRAWLSELPKMDAFGALIFQVIGQQISLQATRAILGRLRTLFRGKIPNPKQLLATRPARLRKVGLSGRKVATLRIAAKRFRREKLSLRKLKKLPDDQIVALLTSIPGVGPWTVQGFLIIALNRGDVVLPGDMALRKAIQKNYHLNHLPLQDEVLEISQRWRPYRSLATAYLFQSAFDAAK
jgi:DNA-3-methyladenine glycosylase II